MASIEKERKREIVYYCRNTYISSLVGNDSGIYEMVMSDSTNSASYHIYCEQELKQ
jgi:hypothetical protein